MGSQSQLLLKKDVLRVALLIGALLGVPCLALILLAQQSLRSVNMHVLHQFRSDCAAELGRLGEQAGQRLLSQLKVLETEWSHLKADSPGFWTAVAGALVEAPVVKAVHMVSRENILRTSDPLPGMPDEPPQLSALHPSQATLRSARRALWGERDYARASALYLALLGADHIPPRVRAAVYSENAQCEVALGHVEAALQQYRLMGDLAAGQNGVDAHGALLHLLHAFELAHASSDDALKDEWTRAILEFLDSHVMDMNPEVAAFALRQVREISGDGLPQKAADRLAQLDLRVALHRFRVQLSRAQGGVPFALVGSFETGFQRALLAQDPGEDRELSAPLLLVSTARPQPDGSRLGFEVNLDVFEDAVLGPALREFLETRGGQWSLVRQNGEAGEAESDLLVHASMRPPLNLMAIRYDMRDSPTLRLLTATRSRFRWAMIGMAVFLLGAGGFIAVLKVGRSLETVRLQANMMDRISHELRTPVAAVSLLAETLQRDTGSDPDLRERVMPLLAAETQRMRSLLERLLSFARQRGGPRPIRSHARLDVIVTRIAGAFPAEMGLNPAAVSLHLEPGDYFGLFDREAIEEALRNLLDNAIKYCERPPQVRLVLRRNHSAAVLTVSDNGIGMDARTRRRIFRPYFRADTQLSARVGGIGIGLSIVQGIIREHRGNIRVASAPGGGSTFEVRLPLIREGGIDP